MEDSGSAAAEAGADAGGTPAGVDRFGLDVTTKSPECIEAIDAYYQAVLAYRPFAAWAIAEDAVERDPACPLARVLAADCAFCRGDAGRATALLEETAADSESGAAKLWTWRERQYVDAWTKWTIAGDPAGCYEALLEVVTRHPTDLFAVKRGHIMGLILGDGAKILAIVERAAAAAQEKPPPKYLHGMWAFGLEQQGRYEEAESKAREGLEFEEVLGPDAWLDHGLAHALYFQGEERLDEAIEFLESRSPLWSSAELHPFLYTHCWWHLSLLYCEKRDIGAAVKVFDERLWADADSHMRSDPQVQLNALNLLWRLETRGEFSAARPRWAQVLAACEGSTLPKLGGDSARAPCQHSDLLLDILLVRGLCAGAAANAKPLDDFLAATAAHAEQLSGGAGGAGGRAEAYAAVARLVAELFRTDQHEAGLAARQSKARSDLRDLGHRWACIGGSEEQRGVLMEAMEGGPVVCGAPEKNYDTLFL